MFAFALVGTAIAGTPVRWPDAVFPISYGVQADLGAAGLDDAAALVEIEQAFVAWEAVSSNGVPCLPGVFQQSKTRVTDAAFGEPPDHRNTVFVVGKNWPHKYKGEPVAVKLVVEDDGTIREADIGLNDTTKLPFAVEGDGHKTLDLQSAVTHAVGHLLGLEDSDDNGATMNSEMVGKPLGRSLETSDEEALCARYPPPTVDTSIPPPSEQGDKCTRNEECTEGFVCVVDNGEEYCAMRCGAEGECPPDTTCEDPGSGSPVCINERDSGCGVVPRTSAGFLTLVLAALAVRGRTRR